MAKQLENLLERAYLFAPGSVIKEIPLEVQGGGETRTDTLREAKKRAAMEVEARVIEDALAWTQGNVSAVARQMGITLRAMHMKLRIHGIDAATNRRGRGTDPHPDSPQDMIDL